MKCSKCGKEMSFENTTGRGHDIGLCEECEWKRPADLPEAGASAERISSVVRLLPCPFCGGHANLMIEMGEYYIKCMMCYTTTGWKDNEESAIKAWNTRQ